jgi:hypothetical protein
MGFLINKVNTVSKVKESTSNIEVNSAETKIELYKPLSDFEWKDATKSERKKIAIKAYKEFAF